MFSLVQIVFYVLCFDSVLSRDVYRAATVDVNNDFNLNSYPALIREAGEAGADILVLPSEKITSNSDLEKCSRSVNNYDEILKTVSKAAKAAQIYVATHVYENIKCQNGNALVRSNLVFDRRGDVVAVYSKPINNANCNTSYSNTAEFSTDFETKFSVLMEIDLVTRNVQDMNVENYIVLGGWGNQNQFLSSPHFAPSWAYATKFNVISANGVYGNTGKSVKSGNITVTDVRKDGNIQDSQIITTPAKSYYIEDLSQYTTKSLDLSRSEQGYEENVCHGSFCCQFYVKTERGSTTDVSYKLLAFDGLMELERGYTACSQICAVSCSGLYKRSCLQSENSTINFKTISISGTFEGVQFPTVLTTSRTTIKNFKFQTSNELKSTQVNTELHGCDNLLRFGIFGRDYSRDFAVSNETDVLDTDYISSENVQEFFDYIWIRLRVVIFVVSIYILEMM